VRAKGGRRSYVALRGWKGNVLLSTRVKASKGKDVDQLYT
jgi:hypothetical protein